MVVWDEIPEVEELDKETIAEEMQSWVEEFRENGEDWHAPEYWFLQKVDMLSLRIKHRAQHERLGLIGPDDNNEQ